MVIHNIIGKHQCAGYNSDETADRRAYIESDEGLTDIVSTEKCPGMTSLFFQSSVTLSDAIKVRGMNREVVQALVEHHWQGFGENRKFLLNAILKN